MLLVAAMGVVKSDVADPVGAKGVQEAFEAVRHQVGMADVAGPLEARRGHRAEEPPGLFDVTRLIVDFRFIRLFVVVFEIDVNISILGPFGGPLHSLYRGDQARLAIRREMETTMADDISTTEVTSEIKVLSQIFVGGSRHHWRNLGHV